MPMANVQCPKWTGRCWVRLGVAQRDGHRLTACPVKHKAAAAQQALRSHLCGLILCRVTRVHKHAQRLLEAGAWAGAVGHQATPK